MRRLGHSITNICLCFGVLISFWGAVGHAATGQFGIALNDIAITSESDEHIDMMLSFNGQPEFSTFSLNNPERLIIDVRGAGVSTTPKHEKTPSFLTEITTSQIGGKRGKIGRITFGFSAPFRYEAVAKESGVLVRIWRQKAIAENDSATEVPIVQISSDDIDIRHASRLLKVESKKQSGGTLLRAKTNGMISHYKVKEVENPKRLVIDLIGVKSRKNMRAQIGSDEFAGIRIGQHQNRTRIVVDTQNGVLPKYDVASTDEGLVFVFASPKENRRKLPPAAIDKANLLPQKGFSRLAINVSGAVGVRTLSNAPFEKVIALDGAYLTNGQPLTFAQPNGTIEFVKLSADEEGRPFVRMHVKVREKVEHSIWQSEGKVFWDIRADRGVKVSPAPRVAAYQQATQQVIKNLAAAQRRFRGKRITIDLLDAQVRNVLRFLADVSGKNIVIAEGVSGMVTLKLKNVPWDQALAVILKVKGLGMEQKGNIIRIASLAQLQAEEEAAAASAKLREESLPLITRLIPVNYAVADDMSMLVKPVLSSRGSVAIDKRTNVIVVNDLRENLEKVERLIRTLDTQTPQILIEARMIEATNEFSTSVGIQWGGGILMSQQEGNPTGLVFPNNVGVVGAVDGAKGGAGTVEPTNYAVNLPSQDSTTAIGLHLGSLGNVGFLNAKIAAAEATSEAKIISAPKITTMDNEAATITQGIQIPVVINNGLQGLSTQFVNAALMLSVTPHVTADGSVLMDVDITNNAPSGGTDAFGVPSVSTKAAKTKMLVKDGDTAVIGGIYQRLEKKAMREVPLLSKIPVLGWLFKNYTRSDSRSELLIFLTPRVINRRQANIEATIVE